jgi:hypothetical protein
MSLFGRYFSERDLRFVNSVNAELTRDIIQTLIVCFKIAGNFTKTNMYGESSPSEGKSFYDGIELAALIERNDPSTDDEGFGPDRDQTVVFKLRQNTCADADYFPEIGDLILFNNRYHEINNVVQEQFLGGQSDKSHSFVCNTHYSRLSKLNIIERQ